MVSQGLCGMLAGAVFAGGPAEAGGSASNIADTHGSWISVPSGKDTSASHQMDLAIGFLGCPINMATGFAPSE